MIPQYSPSELVRIELLAYENPGDLHPIEEQWRDLCRKLIQHVKETENLLQENMPRISGLQYSKLKDWKPFKFPGRFTTSVPATKD